MDHAKLPLRTETSPRLRYTEFLEIPRKNKGRFHVIFEGTADARPFLILQNLRYSGLAIVLYTLYLYLCLRYLFILEPFKTDDSPISKTLYVVCFTALSLMNLLQAGSLSFTNPGFVSHEAHRSSINITSVGSETREVSHSSPSVCLTCQTSKQTDNGASHCYVSGICIEGYDHFCMLLGNALTKQSEQRVLLLIGGLLVQVVLVTGHALLTVRD